MGLQQKYLKCKRHLEEIQYITEFHINELGKVKDSTLFLDLETIQNVIKEIMSTISPLTGDRIKRFEPQESEVK